MFVREYEARTTKKSTMSNNAEWLVIFSLQKLKITKGYRVKSPYIPFFLIRKVIRIMMIMERLKVHALLKKSAAIVMLFQEITQPLVTLVLHSTIMMIVIICCTLVEMIPVAPILLVSLLTFDFSSGACSP